MFGRIRRITESDPFEAVIATLLVMMAGALALESTVDVTEWDVYFWAFFVVSQAVFVVEIVLRVLGYGPRFQDFFRDGWNVFDFVIVAASLVPAVGSLSFAARLVRLVRVLRVLRIASLYFRRKSREEAPS